MCHIFDTHAHYDDDTFEIDRELLLKKLISKDVRCIVNASVDIESSIKSIELSNNYSYIYAAVGIHPQNIENSNFKNNYIEELENLIINNSKVVAIGEIGLDYYFNSENKSSQIKVFEEQIELSLKHDLPILVHDREAHGDTLEILKKYKPKGIVHCFSGSLEMAQEIIKLGMYIGIGGVVTFKNAKTILDVVREIPLENIVLETDAPYLAPVPFRGKRCDSSYIKYVAEKISEIKSIDVKKVYEQTFKNAMNLFKISKIEV